MTRRATSLFVVSDLHLGGEAPAMMSRPALLASFVDGLPARLGDAPASALELVIAGDFVDFVAASPSAPFTPDPREACAKLAAVTRASSPFAAVFDALARHLAAGHRLTVLLGNHDLELALPPVQAALLDRLGAAPHEVLFVADGRAYRAGAALVEHGNRYDGANANDFTNLRAVASALSRGEAPAAAVEPSAGSRLVDRIVNPLKKAYPFLDLLQPQGALVALLLLAFEPSLLAAWDRIVKALRGHLRPSARATAPADPRPAAARPSALLDIELSVAFGEAYEDLRHPHDPLGPGAWSTLRVAPGDDGLAALLAREAPVPPNRLRQIRAVLRKLLLDDATDRLDGPAAQYGAAAERLLEGGDGIEVVVMGHTHLPRRIPMPGGVYLNTGTWADRLRVPAAALSEGDDGREALEAWLRSLWRDERSPRPPTYAELWLDEGGAVKVAEVREAEP